MCERIVRRLDFTDVIVVVALVVCVFVCLSLSITRLQSFFQQVVDFASTGTRDVLYKALQGKQACCLKYFAAVTGY